ncbi:MAG TPA: YceI family protein [Bryobacteraceae bacterium]
MSHYELDKSISRFTVRATAGGLLAAMGHNPTIAIRDFTGTVDFDPADPTKASLRLEIRADSLEVTDDVSSKDKREIETTMHQKVLASASNPKIIFQTTKVAAEPVDEGRFRVTMTGNLSLRGVTRSQNLTTQITLQHQILRASGQFSILQSDFGIAPVTVAGGMLKLKDELKFNYDLVARAD